MQLVIKQPVIATRPFSAFRQQARKQGLLQNVLGRAAEHLKEYTKDDEDVDA